MDLIWTQTVPRKLIDTTSGRDITDRFRGITYPTIPSPAQIAAVAAGKIVLITSNAPARIGSAEPANPVSTSPSYIQVAMFGVPQNAQRTVTKLQGLGIPVRIGNLTRSGKVYQIVMAGPFTQQAELNAALTQVRAAGFTDAYTRN
ncbi:MAG: SPOR domain-containing protein [Rhodobacteraceae bacterium]|nr:SPOR domain-containing protein [Paracoccaceae bacterium]